VIGWGGGGLVDVDGVLRLLGEQETMCRAEVERLEAEQARIAGLLASCRVELERLVVAREVVAGLGLLPPVAAAASPGGGVPALQGTEFGQQLLTVLAAHAGPMRCREVVAALGEDPQVARHGERVRHRLKKLVAADLVIESELGVFTLADGRNPAFG
jgi:hypothetical protein